MPFAPNDIADPATREALERIVTNFRRSTPNTDFEYVTVTFPATANQDTAIATLLRPDNPEAIVYKVVDWQLFTAPAATPCVYRDTSTARRAWNKGNIILRCNVASVTAVLELSVKRTF